MTTTAKPSYVSAGTVAACVAAGKAELSTVAAICFDLFDMAADNVKINLSAYSAELAQKSDYAVSSGTLRKRATVSNLLVPKFAEKIAELSPDNDRVSLLSGFIFDQAKSAGYAANLDDLTAWHNGKPSEKQQREEAAARAAKMKADKAAAADKAKAEQQQLEQQPENIAAAAAGAEAVTITAETTKANAADNAANPAPIPAPAAAAAAAAPVLRAVVSVDDSGTFHIDKALTENELRAIVAELQICIASFAAAAAKPAKGKRKAA